jgi:hypothetical protein
MYKKTIHKLLVDALVLIQNGYIDAGIEKLQEVINILEKK